MPRKEQCAICGNPCTLDYDFVEIEMHWSNRDSEQLFAHDRCADDVFDQNQAADDHDHGHDGLPSFD